MPDTPTPRSVDTPPLEFLGDADGPAEQRLKTALAELLRRHAGVTRAYLARVRHDGTGESMALGLRTSGADNEQLVAEIGRIVTATLDAGARLDITFLSAEQHNAIHQVCRAFYLRQNSRLRIAVFAIAAVEFLIYVATVVWASNAKPGFDLAGAHAMLVVLVLPAVLIGAWGRWLPFALTLLGIAAWMGISVLVAGQISNY